MSEGARTIVPTSDQVKDWENGQIIYHVFGYIQLEKGKQSFCKELELLLEEKRDSKVSDFSQINGYLSPHSWIKLKSFPTHSMSEDHFKQAIQYFLRKIEWLRVNK